MKRRLGLVVAGAVVSTGLVPLAVAAQADSDQDGQDGRASQAQAKISVGTDPVAARVPEQIVGGNHRWPKAGLGMWWRKGNNGQGTLAPGFKDLSEQTNLGAVRYPGGTVAGFFEWEKAVDDPEHPNKERGCQVGGGFVGDRGATLDSHYGPDENQRYVEAIGAQTTMMLNSTTQSVRDAENFVEYMVAEVGENPNGGKDWAKIREANKVEGQPPGPYDIDIWEIGNEPWLQHYWRSDNLDEGLKQYAGVGDRTQKQHSQPVGTECNRLPDAGRSNGKPGQQFRVWYPPVAPETRITLKVGSSDDTWTPVKDLGTVGPDAKRFELNRETGKIRFGNGEDGKGHGKLPLKGALIKATYMSGPHPGFIQFYRGLKAVDRKMAADISVCSSWEMPEFVELMASKQQQFDCVGPHLYTHPDMSKPLKDIHDESISAVKDTIGELHALEKAFDKAIAAGDLKKRPFLEVGEYGKIGKKGSGSGPANHGASISNTLMLASMVIGMIDNDVRLAEISNLNTDKENATGELFGGPKFLSTARAEMLSLVGELADTRPVSKRTTNNPVADGGYHALRVLTTEAADGKLRMFVVNRARGFGVPTTVELPDTVSASGELTVRTLTGDKLDSHNSQGNPDAVKVSESVAKSWTDRGFEHRFEPYSITMLEIPSE